MSATNANSSRPARVVLGLQSTALGGMEAHCVDLAAEYVRRGIDVQAVVPADAQFDALSERFVRQHVPVSRLDTDARHGRLHQARALVKLARLLRSGRPQAVHLHTGGATGGLAFLAVARAFSGGTVVLTEHDVPDVHPDRAQSLARKVLDRTVHGLVAVSRRNAGLRAARVGSPRCFAAVLNGVPLPDDTGEGRATVRARLGFSDDETVVGSLVRLAPGKGLDDLLRAFALVAGTRRTRLLLVGDGPLRGELEALATMLGVRDSVVFAGHQPAPAAYLDAMDVFVLAVPAGSMSIGLLEAMARGLPPIITFGGPEEAVVNAVTGLCPPPSNPPALAEAMATLIDDPCLRRQLGNAAAAHVRGNFSVQRVADDLLDVYANAQSGTLPRRLRAWLPPDVAQASARPALTAPAPHSHELRPPTP